MVRGTEKRLLVATLATASLLAAPALMPDRPGVPGPASARAATARGPLDRAVARLQAAQRDDGGFGTAPGAARSDPATSVWAALALASVGVHPADQPRRGTTALQYLERHADDLTATEDLARLLLVLVPAGRGDDDVARETAAEIVRRQAPDGGLPDRGPGPARLGPTAFAVTALAKVDDPAARAAVGRGAAWLRASAGEDGWGVAPGTPARPDTTALGLQALQAAEPGEVPLSDRAYAFFGRRANADGGFGGTDRRRSTAPATATVLQGLRAFGIDPAKYVALNGTNSTNTVAYLRGRQRPDGGFGDTATTARVLPGLNGVAFPLTAVGRGSDRATGSAPAPADDGEPDRRAAGPASQGGAEALQGARSGGTGTTAPRSGSGSGTGGGSGTGTGTSGSPGASAAAAAPSSGTGGGTPLPTTTAAAPPTTTTTTSTAPAPPTGGGQQVGGTVVGASPAAATGQPGVAAGAGGDGPNRAATVLAGVALLAVAAGTQLERRRPRRAG